MTRSLLFALVLCLPAWAQDPIESLRERYADFTAARYRLAVTAGVGMLGVETYELSVVWERGKGYRAEGPVELLVHAEGKLWRCANHGRPQHVHMIEEQRDRRREELPDLVRVDPVLALLEGLGLPSAPSGWAWSGEALTATGDLREKVRYEFDGDGRLKVASGDLGGYVTRVELTQFEALKAAPAGALSLGPPAPSKPWHELAAAYVGPRLTYQIRARVCGDDGTLVSTREVDGIYSAEHGFFGHLSETGVLGGSGRLVVCDLEHVWWSNQCSVELAAKPHVCALIERRYDPESVVTDQLWDDFVLAANLGAGGIEHVHWTGPWTQDGARWLKHGEDAGTVTEASFDARGRLKLLRSVDDGLEIVWELVQLKQPRKLKASLFEPNLRVHRPK